ncbi:hypothetical protein CURE108131_24690 [Cupriavidus respiraculi]|uniref:Uncharacterized protein n=1 Tax=Cupriavidus respiraculi TaxID=195930 RepID=A0ABM8X1D7_9BURK|nr:hypothetical protein [Cupriavidus respiraculi]MBY4945665.1 hypothetical protein [Cupriavidus respiraculi]CAG9173681.1 hypothetical protein LMG21510_02329 [Cupriavidus respiraculi]
MRFGSTMAAMAMMVAGAMACAACAAPARQAGERITARGELRLSGNMPRPAVVLHTPGEQRWELLGVPLERASGLQGTMVEASGTIERAATTGPQLRAIRVETLTPVER